MEGQDIRAGRAGYSDRDYLVHCRVVVCTTKGCFSWREIAPRGNK